MKEELINHLKTKWIKNVAGLWAEAKDYYNYQHIEMGGGYASLNDFISVLIIVKEVHHRFCVSVSECQKNDN